LAAISAVVLLKRTRRAEAWQGKVVDKTKGMTDGSYLYHYLKVQLDNGQTKKVRVPSSVWQAIAVGDRVTKKAGSDIPTKG
jgi:hypothetical protein